MLTSELMRAVVHAHRPQGLPSDADLERMSADELEALFSQQTAIIDVFRREASTSIAHLRAQMDSLQPQAPASAPLPGDSAAAAIIRLPAAIAIVQRPKLGALRPAPPNPFLAKPAAARARKPPFRPFICPRCR
jgi:hypothetical protein